MMTAAIILTLCYVPLLLVMIAQIINPHLMVPDGILEVVIPIFLRTAFIIAVVAVLYEKYA